MIIRGFNVSLGSCGFSYVFSCLRLLSDVGIKKIHIGNRYVRKAWNLTVARSTVEVFELTRLSKRATKTPRCMYTKLITSFRR